MERTGYRRCTVPAIYSNSHSSLLEDKIKILQLAFKDMEDFYQTSFSVFIFPHSYSLVQSNGIIHCQGLYLPSYCSSLLLMILTPSKLIQFISFNFYRNMKAHFKGYYLIEIFGKFSMHNYYVFLLFSIPKCFVILMILNITYLTIRIYMYAINSLLGYKLFGSSTTFSSTLCIPKALSIFV